VNLYTQTGLEPPSFHSQPSNSWDYRHEPLCLDVITVIGDRSFIFGRLRSLSCLKE
jgi:hypothetical protein